MKRVLYVFVALLAGLFVLQTPARAISELCPAGYRMAAIKGTDIPRSLFGLELTAEGARSVTASIAFDTDVGWFVASLPPTKLHEKDLHYESPTASFMRRTWISPLMYVKFPSTVKISHSWVLRAQTADDDFGWSKKGEVLCQPGAGAHAASPLSVSVEVKLDPKDVEQLTVPPDAGATIANATTSPPLKQSNCATPFQDARTTRQSVPQYPMMARRPAVSATSTIAVAINADGSPADAWVLYPSGFQQFDDTARQAALNSKYRSGIAYCEAVPGIYLFKVTFSPNS